MPQKHGPRAGVGVRVSPAVLTSNQHDRTCTTLRRSRLRVRAPRCSYTDHVAQRIGRSLAKREVAGSTPAVVIAPPAVDGVVVDRPLDLCERPAYARVAQEEERLVETQEAAGSMPAASTEGARPDLSARAAETRASRSSAGRGRVSKTHLAGFESRSICCGHSVGAMRGPCQRRGINPVWAKSRRVALRGTTTRR